MLQNIWADYAIITETCIMYRWRHPSTLHTLHEHQDCIPTQIPFHVHTGTHHTYTHVYIQPSFIVFTIIPVVLSVFICLHISSTPSWKWFHNISIPVERKLSIVQMKKKLFLMFQKDFFLTRVSFYKITFYFSITQMIIYFLCSKIGSMCTSDKLNCSILK